MELLSGRIPVLTVRQPWAWAIAHGGKPVENRSWYTRYRGPLWLHAGARSRWDPAGADSLLVQSAWRQYLEPQRAAFHSAGLRPTELSLTRSNQVMAFGAVIALAEVQTCHWPADCRSCSPWAVEGQYHIVFHSVRPLAEPVACTGALGLWKLPQTVETAARAQINPEATDGRP